MEVGHWLACFLKSPHLKSHSAPRSIFHSTFAGSALIAKNQEGMRVRVVTDSEQVTTSGSQIGRLRKEGILVRHDTSSYLMHHKFAVVDGGKIALAGL